MESNITTDGQENPNNNPIASSQSAYTPENLKLVPNLTLQTYKDFVMPLALNIESLTGINHLVPIAQSAHESANGNSGLARNHCNLFGIVATDRWKKNGGAIANMPTFEFINGHRVDMSREFRAYPSWMESFKDWADLISRFNIYQRAYELLKNTATVPEGITAMGSIYATDPAYARSLTAIYSSLLSQ